MERENCVYTSCYCEENVWKLCEFVRTERTAPLDELFVLFISNENRMVPMWKQKSGRGDQPVIWDYHVVLLQVRRNSSSVVYDLDTELSFPCSLKQYAAQALRSDRHIQPAYHRPAQGRWKVTYLVEKEPEVVREVERKLRVVPADSFLLNFASDRSHMKNSDGSWRMPPPPYPPIRTTECQMNLEDFISMSPAVGWGQVFSLDHFLQRHMGGSSSSSSAAASSSS